MPTCERLIEIGLCPKMKNQPLCGWIFIVCRPISGAAFFHKNAAINMYDRLRLRIVSV